MRLLRRFTGTTALLAVAALINLGLFGLAGFLTSKHRPPQDIIDPVGVSLVSLEAPEPPAQEEIKEPEPPPAEQKPDFMPDLVQPSLAGGGGFDFALKVDLGGIDRGQNDGAFIFDSVDLDQAPQALVRIPPDYPYSARERGIEGWVAVKFLIREDGSVGKVNILKSKPRDLFEEEVRRILPRWRFQPGRIGGEAVASWMVTTIRFDLN